MPINTATITPASLKAKEVATEDYVNSAVSSVSIDDATWQTKVQQALDSDTTTIDGGRITTNSLSANRLSSTSGSSTIWSGGGLVSSNFNGNVVGSIGTPTQGFRLSSNAAGTSADPNIYGGYTKGGTIDGATIVGETFDVANMMVANGGGNTGRLMIYKSTYTPNSGLMFYGKNYGTGFNDSRLVATSQRIHVQASTSYWSGNGTLTTSVTIQYSLDGGAWTNITSQSMSGVVFPTIISVIAVGELVVYPTTFTTLAIRFVPAVSGGYQTRYEGGHLTVATSNL